MGKQQLPLLAFSFCQLQLICSLLLLKKISSTEKALLQRACLMLSKLGTQSSWSSWQSTGHKRKNGCAGSHHWSCQPNTLSPTQPVSTGLEKSEKRTSTSALPPSTFVAFNGRDFLKTGMICPLHSPQKTFSRSSTGLPPLHEEPLPPARV